LQQLAKLQSYRRRLGWRATLSRLALEARRRLAAPGHAEAPPAAAPRLGPDWAPAAGPLSGRPSAPLFYRTPRASRRRVTLLCQRIDPPGQRDGMQAALALAVLSANRLQADLRLIATQQAIDPCALNEWLRGQGLAVQGECILGGPALPGSSQEFDRFDGELMLAACSRCAADALAELPVEDLVCLLHPDDPGLRDAAPGDGGSAALLARTDLRFAVGTQRFQQHLVGRGFPHLAQQATSFEPADRQAAAAMPPPPASGRDVFLFEVMAPVDRQRFAIGLDAIEQALALGVLDPQRWDFLFAAPGLPQVTLRQGQRPTSLDHLDAGAAWQARQQALLALRLPPPGAALPPPLGVAAEHAVVVVATAVPADAAPGAIHGAIPGAIPGALVCALQRDAVVQALRQAVERLGGDAHPSRRQPGAAPARDDAPGLAATAALLTAGR